jgi:hypothetical protein
MADAGFFFGATGAVFLGWMAGVTMDELGRRLTDLVEPTRTESACLNYDLRRSNEDPAT